MNEGTDIICALATPAGIGALGVVRLSGKGCVQLVSDQFSKDLNAAPSHTLHFGTFMREKQIIDEVLISVFLGTKSFTGEESVEISCHGSAYILNQVLDVCVTHGARLANPGEFTQRAFLNGKLDLSQAEAVADLIASNSQASHLLALNQLKGNLSNELKELRKELINFASLLELELDFGEEDVEFADRSQLLLLVNQVLSQLINMARTFELGNAIKEGVPVAIVGPPNSGKSSLLNALLNEDKAIVSDIAGTTRDAIEDTLNINGTLFRFVDTAGIRESIDEIEKIGIEKAYQKIRRAKIVLCLSDGSNDDEMKRNIEWVDEMMREYPDKHITHVINKVDLLQQAIYEGLYISAKNKQGINELKDWIYRSFHTTVQESEGVIVSNIRHKSELDKTIIAIEKAKFLLEQNVSSDLVSLDIRSAMHHLGNITGEISSEDLLTNIFSSFCIGK